MPLHPARSCPCILRNAVLALGLCAAGSAYAAPIRVLTVGDSITANGSINYRSHLSAAALQRGCELAFVGDYADVSAQAATRHSAISGIRADTVDASYITPWMRNARPDVVLIHLGTNDSWQGRPAAATVASLGSIIDKVRQVNPSARIFLAQIIPATIPGLNALATQVNALIPGLAAAKTSAASPVVVVDQSTGFSAAADTSDGVHPTQNGQNKMGARWFEALVAAGICKAGPRLVNLAEGRPLNTSVGTPGGTPHLAVDNDTGQGGWDSWSASALPQSIEVDLGKTSTLEYLELTHSARSPVATDAATTRGYRIELSQNRSNWTTVVTVTGNLAGRTSHDISPTPARYVRLTVDNPSAYGLSYNQVLIREFRVMGLPD